MEHGPAESTAYRFDCDGKTIGYATDFSAINKDMIDLFWRVDLLVIDCLRREPHPTHAHLGMALELATATKAGRAVLTHMDRSMDYATVMAETPDHVLVGHDGLVLAA
jgi:phosphoribosyl 1,2-cyclic phosphate phosphodiesterase